MLNKKWKLNFKAGIRKILGRKKLSVLKRLIKKVFSNPARKMKEKIEEIKFKRDPQVLNELKTIRNEYELRLFGMRRSGNHAIVVWITNHFDEPGMFLNSIRHFEDPFKANRDNRVVSNCIDSFERTVEQNRLMKKKFLFYSYGDLDIRELKNRELVANRIYKLGKSKYVFNILLLRDPFNVLASRIKNNNNKGKKDTLEDPEWISRYQEFMMLWKVHAREFSDQTNYLGHKIKINYNK